MENINRKICFDYEMYYVYVYVNGYLELWFMCPNDKKENKAKHVKPGFILIRKSGVYHKVLLNVFKLSKNVLFYAK